MKERVSVKVLWTHLLVKMSPLFDFVNFFAQRLDFCNEQLITSVIYSVPSPTLGSTTP